MPSSPSRPDAEATRRAIVRAAHDLFMQSGYRGVTTRMVAEASGVKQPLIYYHFADKEALYVEVQRERAQETGAALLRIAARHGASIAERLRAVMQYLRSSHQMNMGLYMHDLHHEISPTGRTALSDAFRAHILAPIMAIFADGIATGVLRAPTNGGVAPRLAAFLVLSIVMHLPDADALASDADPRAELGAEPVDAIVRTLLFGMAAIPPEAEAPGG
jgi:AcrR family transcriptional regulator